MPAASIGPSLGYIEPRGGINFSFIVPQPSEAAGIEQAATPTHGDAMKQIFPLVFALIPLAAVIGACVSCP